MIGKYQPQRIPKGSSQLVRAPSRVKYNPIVYDKAFKKLAQDTNVNPVEGAV